MNPAAILDIVVKADTNGAISGLRRVDRQAAQSSKSFDRLAKSGERSLGRLKIAAAAGAAAFVVVGKSAIDMASDIAEQTSKIETVLGRDASKVIQRFAQTSAKSFGISKQEALGAAGSFASMFKLIGQTSPVAAQMSVQMTKLAADMASFSNATPTEALTALQAGLRGESEPLRRFNVLLDDATLKQQALAMGLVKTTQGSLTPQQRALAAYGVIMKQTSVQQGDFARTSGGLANQQRILKAEVSNLQAELGAKLLPVMLKVVDKVRTFLQQMKTGEGAGGRFAAALDKISTAAAPILKFFAAHKEFFVAAVAGWAAYRVAAIGAAIAAAFATGGVSVAIAAVVTAAALLGSRWQEIWAGMKVIAETAVNFVIDRINDLIDALNKIQPFGDIGKVGKVDFTKDGGKPGVPRTEALPTLKGPTTASKIMSYLMGQGYSKQAAAGFVGNFMQESGLRPGAEEAGGGGGFGLAQWTGGRRKQLEAYAKKHGSSAGDLATQLEFLTTEVASSPGFFSRLQKARTPEEAASIIEREFERPKAGPTANSKGRQQWAAQAFAGTISKTNAAEQLAAGSGTIPGSGSAAASAGKQTAMDRFNMAAQTIGLRQSSGQMSSSQAAQAMIDLTSKALAGKFGKLGVRDRLSVVTARREAQKTLAENKRAAAQRASEATMKRFGGATDLIGLKQSAKVLSSSQAAEATIATTTKALAGKYGKLSPEDRLRVITARREAQATLKTNQADAAQRAKDAADAAKEAQRNYAGTAYGAAALAMAQTDTPGDKSDDLAVFRSRRDTASTFYQQAKASGVEDDIVYWAGQINENTQAITDLTQATEDQTQQLQEQLAIQKELTAAANRRANAAEAQGPAILKSISDMISGQIGGQVGLGMMTPGFSGGMARY